MTNSLEPYITPFIGYLKFEKRYSSHTVVAYKKDLEQFAYFVADTFHETDIQKIRYQQIRSWLVDLKEKKNTSKSINRKISSLRSFYKFHLKTGSITINPTIKIVAPKVGKKLPVFIKEEDISQLSHALQTASEDWKSLNAKMVIALFYATGIRLSELVNLKEHQVDFGRKQLKVLGKGNKERSIPISADMLQHIKAYITQKRKDFSHPPETLLTTEKGKKPYTKYAYLLVKKYLSEIPTLHQKSPHVLRHTFATHLVNAGAEINAVKELLGHSSLAATQVYTHNTIEKLKEVYKNAHPKA